jgi:hypothetical protein
MLLLPQFSPNPNILPVEAGLVLLVAILASLGFTLGAFQVFELRTASRKSIGGSIIGAGAGGTVLAAFASACSVCQPVWLFWLGLGSATAFLADYGLYVLLASLAILVYSLNAGLTAIVCGCPVHGRIRVK